MRGGTERTATEGGLSDSKNTPTSSPQLPVMSGDICTKRDVRSVYRKSSPPRVSYHSEKYNYGALSFESLVECCCLVMVIFPFVVLSSSTEHGMKLG